MADEREADAPPVELSAEETAVMLGHFAGHSFSALATTTGVPPARLEAIVTRLTRLGLIEAQLIPLEDEAPAEPGPALGFDAGYEPDAGALEPLTVEDEVAEPVAYELEDPPTADDGLVALLDMAMDGLVPPADGPVADAVAKPRAAGPAPGAAHAGHAGHATSEAGPSEPPPPAEEEPLDLSVDEPRVEAADQTREYQKLYATEMHPLPTDERVALATTSTGPHLFALCFDPEPPVIGAIFENGSATVEHARLVAFHHRTARGLEELVRRTYLANDPLVHRRLVRNPATNEAMFRRLVGGKRLLEIYKMSLDRDVPDKSRSTARALFRTKFTTASPEERVEIVWATEGRVLMAMAGLTFDSRTTSILCSRNYASIMLIQSLARFPATPPQLIAHLLRQPLVKRQVHLKNQLLSHPNTPSDAKRRV
jgi:hypothetical protein